MQAIFLTLLLSLALLSSSAQAGILKDFEKAASTPVPQQTKDSSSDSARNELVSSLLGPIIEDVGGIIGYCFICSGARSMVYALGDESSMGQMESCPESVKDVERRAKGDVLVPFARADAGYQAVRGGVEAVDVRAEAGYGLLGLSVRHTAYWDRKSDETMSATSIVPQYRALFGKYLEVDPGFGVYMLDGSTHHAGTSLSIPVLIHPFKHAGLEFRPAWSNLQGGPPISDYGLNLVLRLRYAALTGGYRWVRSGGAALDGPAGGISLLW